MLSKHTVRILLGIAILGNSVNLLIFTAGRLTREMPPIIPGRRMDGLPSRRRTRCRRR
jgi:multicomponent Na+:H+ antiporter subunit C